MKPILLLPRAAIDKHVAILGKTGSGKTYAAKGLVEHLLDDNAHVCIIDPTSAWWGLRAGSDGKPSRINVIIAGGDHADVPLPPTSGDACARLVSEQGANVVFDTGSMMVGEYERWFTDFAQALYATVKGPLHLVIDEAHQFLPQGKVLSPQGGKMLHAGNRLMSGGRSRGIRAIMITQRPAKLHKDSLTCADTLVAMRVVAPQDREAIEDWLKGAGNKEHAREVLDSLASLQTGEGFVWFPEGDYFKREKCPPITTFDSSAAPKAGKIKAVTLGEIDLTRINEQFAAAAREAEANDPKKLRAELGKLKAAFEVQRRSAGTTEEFRELQDRCNGFSHEAAKYGELALYCKQKLGEMLETFNVKLKQIDGRDRIDKTARTFGIALESGKKGDIIRVARTFAPAAPSSATAASLSGGETNVLTAIIQYPNGLQRNQLTILTGYARSTRDKYLSLLVAARLVLVRSDTKLVATDHGKATLPNVGPLPSGLELREFWRARLPSGELRIFETIVENGRITRERLTEFTGFARSTRDKYLSRLKAKEIVDADRSGVELAEMLRD